MIVGKVLYERQILIAYVAASAAAKPYTTVTVILSSKSSAQAIVKKNTP